MTRLPSAASRSALAASVAPLALACAVVALQIVYPLTPAGDPRDRLTVVIVVVFFAASATHALLARGGRFAVALVVVTAGGGWLVEALGVSTGLPFGAYRYTDTLGPALAGVPLVIPLAWTMMAYPAYAVGRRIATRPLPRAVVAGWALASWDLFLDPQMVDAGHWVWEAGGPALLGIPLSNFAGWFAVAVAMMALVDRAEQRAERPAGESSRLPGDLVPCGLYLWTYGSSVLAHAAYLGLPGSAVLGGVGMGAVVLAFALAVRR